MSVNASFKVSSGLQVYTEGPQGKDKSLLPTQTLSKSFFLAQTLPRSLFAAQILFKYHFLTYFLFKFQSNSLYFFLISVANGPMDTWLIPVSTLTLPAPVMVTLTCILKGRLNLFSNPNLVQILFLSPLPLPNSLFAAQILSKFRFLTHFVFKFELNSLNF